MIIQAIKDDDNMADREKVEQGIKACWSKYFYHSCLDCPYMINRDDEKCVERLGTDALELLKEQEAKTGYWIDSAGNNRCSNCGAEYSDLYPDYVNTHFCPNCGAKMERR